MWELLPALPVGPCAILVGNVGGRITQRLSIPKGTHEAVQAPTRGVKGEEGGPRNPAVLAKLAKLAVLAVLTVLKEHQRQDRAPPPPCGWWNGEESKKEVRGGLVPRL